MGRSISILIVFGIVLVIIVFVALAFGSALPADAHKHDRPDLDGWFDSLQSEQAPCCDHDEGTGLLAEEVTSDLRGCTESAYFEKPATQYCVLLEGKWWLVPDKAVLRQPNRYGQPIVWVVPIYTDNVYAPYIRCFITGAGI